MRLRGGVSRLFFEFFGFWGIGFIELGCWESGHGAWSKARLAGKARKIKRVTEDDFLVFQSSALPSFAFYTHRPLHIC